MSFTENLKTILNELKISDEDRSSYTEDAVEIQNYVVEQLKAKDTTFRKAFDGLSLGGSYLDRVKLETPDEFDLHLMLKIPYKIFLEEDEKGFVFLYAPKGVRPIVTDGYIRRRSLQNWLRGVFRMVFSPKTNVHFTTTSDKDYTLRYTKQGGGCAHTIEAVSKYRKISFDFVPAFKFSSSLFPFDIPSGLSEGASKYPWFFAIPQKKSGSNDRRTFMVCAPHWEREMIKNSYNFKNVLRLMKGLRDGQWFQLPHLSSYMLKTVMLHKHESEDVDWKENEGLLLLEMWGSLVDHLRSRRLNFILAEDHNLFRRMNSKDLDICLTNAKAVLKQLRRASDENDMNALSQLFHLFHLTN